MTPMYKLISLATVLTIFFLNNSEAQELKTKTRTVSGTTELYQVLKSSQKIMHGYYEKVTSWGQVVTRGSYHQNKRAGIWEFFDFRTGLIEQKYDYDNNKFLVLNTESSKQDYFRYKDQWMLGKLDTVPVVIGGLSNLRLALTHLAYSKTRAPKFPKAGTAVFSFVVTASGQTKDFKITQSSGNVFEKALLAAIKKYPEPWLPGVYQDQKVDTEFMLPMTVKYEENTFNVKRYVIHFNYPPVH